MKRKADWKIEGRDWPNRETSRFVTAAGFSWHVQIMGKGPVVLLIHGTGAATHSWRDLAPELAKTTQVISFDLPGHGFTQPIPGGIYSLPRMAAVIGELLGELKLRPEYIVGHSAGAAIAVRMALDMQDKPKAIVSLNGALMPFPGAAFFLYPALARLLFLNPLAAPLLAWRASSPSAVARVIRGTGSQLDPVGLDLYQRLLQTEQHVGGTVGMMANWDLLALHRELPRFDVPLSLIVADGDRAVPPRTARAFQKILPSAKFVPLSGYGHLAHEEAPALLAGLIQQEFQP